MNSEIRKNVLKYDDVLRLQREIIYGERTFVLTASSVEDKVRGFIDRTIESKQINSSMKLNVVNLTLMMNNSSLILKACFPKGNT